MSDISELEGRITAALDRIRRGIEARPAQVDAPDPAEAESLRAELEEERTASAQLAERVKALKERQDTKLATLESEADEARKRLGKLDSELQSLRESNAELRALTSELRQALEAELPEEALVNRAILAELEALQAARAADRAEMDAILGELSHVIEEEAS